MMNGEETDGGISLGDMEKALVCLLMTSMEAPVQAESAGLTQEMFADASLGFVYEVIMKIYATGVRPDMVLVERGMREADEELAAKLGGLSFLLPYMLNVRHDGNVAAYVEGIKKLDYTVGATVEQIRAKVLLQCRLGKCDLVVVDYLHLLGGDRRKGETQEQMVGRNVRALKQLALDSNCPVLTVSQMNRACEARADKAYLPVMSDLRDSGTIEQVADCVAFIYRPERYGFTRDEKTGHSLVGVGKIYIAKNRNGSTGIARFRYNPSFTRITDYIQPGTQTSLGL